MNGEVTILVKTNDAPVEYTATFDQCPQEGDIACESYRLVIDTVTLSPQPDNPIAVWEALANSGDTVEFFDTNDVSLGSLTINNFNVYLYFNPSIDCTKIAEDACYFKFTVGEESNKVYLDLYPNEVISQNWEFTEISTFSARAPFSRDFRAPLTEVNAQIFNAVQIPTYSGVDFYNTKLNATILVDDVPVISGFIRLIRSVLQAGVRTDLELSFYGNTPSLFTLVGQKKLRDIVDLPTLNVTVTKSIVRTPPTSYVTYAMIDRGSNNSLTIERLTTERPPVTAFTPCITWGWLLRNIIKDAGYELDATDLLSELDTVWMPWLGKSPFILTQSVGGCLIIKQSTGLITLTDSNTKFTSPSNGFIAAIDPLSYYNSTLGWGPSGVDFLRGVYETSAWVTFDYPYNTATTITLYLYTVSVNPNVADDYYQVAFINIPANTPGTYYIGGNLTLTFTASDVGNIFPQKLNLALTSTAAYGGSNTVNVYAGDPDQPFIGTGFSVNQVLPTERNSWYFDFPANSPDATQVQFLQDVVNMFNCAIIQDRLVDTKIKIVPMVNYLGTGITDDWGDYLAYDKDIVIKSTSEFLRNKLNYTYSAGGDSNSKYFIDNARHIYGNYEVSGYTANPTDTPNEFAQGSLEIKLTTQSTPCSVFPGTTTILPRFIDNSDPAEYVEPGMRALYLADSYNVTEGGEYLPIRLLNHYDTLPADAPDKDLNWAPEAPLHFILTNPVNNLFNRYWRGYLNELYSPQGRVMEAYFNLSLGDIVNFDFSNKYFINDSYWRVLKISDYKIGSGELTKVTLIKILNLNLSDCNLEVDRSLPDGSYTWTFNGEPATGTLPCCQNVGGTWDAITDKCYGRPNNGRTNVGIQIPPTIFSNAGLPTNSVTKTDNYNGAFNTIFQVAVGKDITDLGSSYSVIVGRDIGTDITPDSGIIGRNALVKNTGFHFGGGYRAGVGNPGTMQAGTIILSNTNVFTFNGDQVVLTIGNDSITHIDLPNDTQWLVTIDLIATDLTGFWIYSKTSTSFLDVAGTGAATPVNIITTDDAGAGALNILPVIDVVSTPGLFKIWAQVNTIGAFTYPTPALLITATVNYTQAR